jgi:hypothetical protein
MFASFVDRPAVVGELTTMRILDGFFGAVMGRKAMEHSKHFG